jgi:hypothetical protein
MRVAARHLEVPPYQFRLRLPSTFEASQAVVVKSLTTEPVGAREDRELLFTTKVDDRELSPECPWMVQSYVHADRDVTVAFVRDRLFAFELDRSSFREKTADWREMPVDWEAGKWHPHALPEAVSRGITGFMHEMGLHFGRLDFLLGADGYYFLEVNANGEWAWLDTEGRHGGTSPTPSGGPAPDAPARGVGRRCGRGPGPAAATSLSPAGRRGREPDGGARSVRARR